ncbi:VC2046/SO_2500 family protein [Thalassomonas viridans]|uniref:VC2046/SO_2500 family protein n=1 Tax=Thalassomonas viridans TaxID=137584 RepID=UPI00069F4346|nr:VC2046/SO_2500 family protein [Thalassomonas viridans]
MVAKVENNLLVHELQLGEQLGECVHSKRRSDFALMLAMLTEDVRDHSQFALPVVEEQPRDISTEALRKEFHLPDEAPLALKNDTQIQEFNQAELVHDNQLASLHLENAINPKPLAFRDDKRHVPHQVMTNTTTHCQQKHRTGTGQVSRMAFNAKGWLDAVKTSMVKSAQVNVHSIA